VSTYSTRFFIGAMPTAQGVLYTVPAGFTVVLRDIELYQYSGGSGLYYLAISAAGSNAIVYAVTAAPTASSYHWDGRVVMNAGDELLGQAAAANNQVVVSGYLLAN
jgi:hypothetical protein